MKTCNNGHCKEIVYIRLFRIIIEHLVKAEYDIFVALILTQVLCNTSGKPHKSTTRKHKNRANKITGIFC